MNREIAAANQPSGASARTYTGMTPVLDTNLGSDATTLWRVTRLILHYHWRVTIALGATLCAAAFQLMIPQFLGDAVDGAMGLLQSARVAPDVARAALFQAAMLLLGAAVLRGCFTAIHNYTGEAIGHLIAYDLRMAMYDKLQRLSYGFHDKVHSGELITRGMLDIEGVRRFFNTGLMRIVLLCVLIGVGAKLLISTDTTLGLLSLSFVPVVAVVSSWSRLRMRAMWWRIQELMAVLGRVMDENLTGIRVVRAFGAEPHELDRFGQASENAMAMTAKRIRIRVNSTTFMNFSYYVAMGLVLWVGGERVLAGAMSVGTLAEFLAFMTILQAPVRQLGLVLNSLARTSVCGARLFAVLDMEPIIQERDGARPLETGPGTVRFEDVSFEYTEGAGPRVLNGVTFEVRRGRTLGIVGPPGSGKSTVAHLITRHYDATDGRITIDGTDIRDVTLDSLRQAVRVVHQDTFLFTASIENNIAYGDPWAEDEAIHSSAAVAQIDDFVESLPGQYETLVGERGISLSGGQRQRVAIARTAMLRPDVLVLDDSTAAIDAETERNIREALSEHTQNAAVIIVSHRLSALSHADEIIFLDRGRIVERGTHEDLIAAAGPYAALSELQSRA